MASTAAAFLSAAGRRLSRSTASTIICRQITGHHNFKIAGLVRPFTAPKIPTATSKPFDVAGYSWKIACRPHRSIWEGDYVSLELAYDGWKKTDPVKFEFTLLDPATGEPVPSLARRSPEACVFDSSSIRNTRGFHDFIRWIDLENSGCLDDDGRFAVRCDVTVIKDWAETSNAGVSAAAAPASGGAGAPATGVGVVVPPSNLHEHLGRLLSKKAGADMTIQVGDGEDTYEAHWGMLEARSPVLAAELDAAATEKKVPGGGVRRRVVVRDMEPKVFEAMLRFIYTDALPKMKDAVAMAQGLLPAAHRYELDRLKMICEKMLCERIDVETVAGTLAVAEKHGCRGLKDACLEFMASPGNLKKVMETEGYQKVKADCQAALVEFALRQDH